MELLDAEKFVALRGILGCPLADVPSKFLNAVDSSEILEIVVHDDNLTVPDSLLYNLPKSKTYSLKELKSYTDYDVRMNFEAWRALAFNNSRLHAGRLAQCVSVLMANPHGVTRKTIKGLIPNSEKNIHKWVQQLAKENVICIENVNGSEILKFNFDLIEKANKLPAQPTTHPKDNDATVTTTKDYGKAKVTNEIVQQAEKVIKEHENIMPIRDLQESLMLEPETAELLVDKLGERPNYQVHMLNGKYDKIEYIGEMNTMFATNDMVDFLIDMCRASRILVMSELPKDIKKMKASLQLDDERFLDVLEDSDFSIIEIRSKYISSEFVIFSDTVSDTDFELINIIEKAKAKVVKYFRTKVKYTFLKNVYLNAFDNNYLPCLKERVLHFYKYIVSQMECSSYYFYLNSAKLLDMDFTTFIRCVPLRLEFQFIKIVSEIAKKNRKLKSSVDLPISLENVDNIPGDVFEKLNLCCLEAVSSLTLGDVLGMLKKGSDAYNALASRINICEFDRILQAFLKYNIFEGFNDDQKYLFFEHIEGIEKYIEKILSDISDDPNEVAGCSISYPARKKLYDLICDLSQDEFHSKTLKLIEQNFEGDAKEFFLKKLQTFK